MGELALVVPFPGLPDIVGDWLERTVPTKPSHGMPPHVTLLYPAPGDVVGIAETLWDFAAFDVDFGQLDRFPGTLWLAPEPSSPFREMTSALAARYPDYPPYRGTFEHVIPHLTVAQAELNDAAAAIADWLPLRARAESAVLLEQVQSEHWREVATFDLEDV
jgi:2'-5' RNA ligase superfamily protein